MRKFLAIIALGLLLSGCSSPEQKQVYQQQQNENQTNRSNYFREAVDKAAQLDSMSIERGLMAHSFFSGYDYAGAANMCAQKKKFYFHFQGTSDAETKNSLSMYYNLPLNRDVIYCSREYLTVDPVHGRRLPSYISISPYSSNNILASTNYNEAQAASWENIEIKPVEESKDMLANIKNTCIEFGYKEGTEKLADCMKDLYLKQTQPTTTIVQGTTTTPSKPKRTIDPSVWDDIINMSIGMSQGASVTEALGGVSSTSESKIQCFKTGERVSGTNKICSYNCMGSETTRNIPSSRICPISIDLN